MPFKNMFLLDDANVSPRPRAAMGYPPQPVVDEEEPCRGQLASSMAVDTVEAGLDAPLAQQLPGFTSVCSSQHRFEWLWRKTERSYLVWAREGRSYAAGSTGPRGSDRPTSFLGTAEADFSEDMDRRQNSGSQVSSVEPNPEDDGEDFDVLSVALKRPESERSRREHLRSSELGARFCYAWGIGKDERGSNDGRGCGGEQNGWGVGGEAAATLKTSDEMGKWSDNKNCGSGGDDQTARSMGSGLEGCRGNTALKFSSKDLDVVRAIALILMEEREKKGR
ncbi:hypothetical protein TraAM80_08045 [Trypanosoma rangeli]|uniref:Uncharacterized protein n=1 Tax=Trypanosoma rangeli TaxID=5698 RepID=A0A422N2D7_TRYRA|nr:uncharacterized protein TraAM80_08045 [Trypanosoma rangeli]RNE99621.1 hypothetical protein TraAM80_08045 [Trypanosoma rangeli]|eukprot:RNE99621.1 hypothetical protein TraAM80_08045 [Trypanosoma rangeli]